MATLIKQLHGTTAELAEYAGQEFVIVVNSDTHRLHVLDGKTKSGFPLALVSDVPATPTAEQIVYKKTTVAAAIDDIYTKATALQTAVDAKTSIDDANAASTTTTYSAKKIEDVIVAAKKAVKDDLLGGAGEAVDTLKELATLIDTNKDAIAALQTIANGHVKFDGAQTLTEDQKTQARANIDAVSSAQLATKLAGTVAKVGETPVGDTAPAAFNLDALVDEGEFYVANAQGRPAGVGNDYQGLNVSVRKSGSLIEQVVRGTEGGRGRFFIRKGTVGEGDAVTWSAWGEVGAQQDLSDCATKTEVQAAKTQADKGVSDAAAAKKAADAAKSKADANETAINGLGSLAHKSEVGAAELAAVIDLGSIA